MKNKLIVYLSMIFCELTIQILIFVSFIELYMVRDRSEDFENTWHFLDRRFQDIRMTGNIKRTVRTISSLMVSFVITAMSVTIMVIDHCIHILQCSKLGEDVTNLACSSMTLVSEKWTFGNTY